MANTDQQPPDSYGYGYGYGPEMGGASTNLTPAKVLHALVERAWLVILCTVIAGVAAWLYGRNLKSEYTTTSILMAEQTTPKVLGSAADARGDEFNAESLKTVERMLKNRALLYRVLVTNNLPANLKFAPPEPGKPPLTVVQMVDLLEEIVTVKQLAGTRLIQITVRHSDPKLAAQIADAVPAELMRMDAEMRGGEGQVWLDRLSEEIQTLETNLMQDASQPVEVSAVAFQRSAVMDEISRLREMRFATNAMRIQLETELANLQKLKTDTASLLMVPILAGHPEIQQRRGDLERSRTDFERIKERYKEKHPAYQAAERTVQSTQTALENALANILTMLKVNVSNAVVVARASEDRLNREFEAKQDRMLELERKLATLKIASGDEESRRSVLAALVNRMTEIPIMRELQGNRFRILQPADVPETPARANKVAVLLMGIIAGLGLGVAAAVGLGMIDPTFRTVDEVEGFLSCPVLGAIPLVRGIKSGHDSLVIYQNPKSPGAEAFRSLRTSLAMIESESEKRIFLFTSAVPEEGKTFCSMNFSMGLAQTGLTTLLIDCDLRRPTVEMVMTGARGAAPGLTDYLSGRSDFASVIQKTNVEEFNFISAGTEVPNPAELLAKPVFNDLLKEALAKFDRVVLDSAPVQAVSDTLLLVKKANCACLVIRAGKTPRRVVNRAFQTMAAAGASLSGVVLNRIQRRGPNIYYYDYSYTDTRSKHGVYGA